jgi:hypothetical protein
MGDGALLDLVSRGRKDAYFTNADARRTWFGAPYERRSASTREIRVEYPEAGARFGHWVDIDLPRVGDILYSADIRIQMPTWLPPPVAALNKTHTVEVESRVWPGTFLQYGWTNGVANYLIKRWAVFADNIMLLEGWGEFNTWFPDMETSHQHAPLLHASTGIHTATPRELQRAATPGELVFRLPLMGCQGDRDVGLPLCALPGQRLYVRLWLADKKELVESSLKQYVAGPTPETFLPEYEICPEPWGSRAIRIDGVPSEYTTLMDYEIGQPYIYGRFGVLHLDEEARVALRAIPHSITFRQEQREDFIIKPDDFLAGSLKRRLEIHGMFQALYLTITSEARLQQNKYRLIDPPTFPIAGEWLNNLSLNVNGLDRIYAWDPKKFQELANNTQMRRDIHPRLYFLIFGVNPYVHEPAGTCNLSRVQKATLLLDLVDQPPDPTTGSNQAFASVLGLSWNVFEIRDGVGRLKYAD